MEEENKSVFDEVEQISKEAIETPEETVVVVESTPEEVINVAVPDVESVVVEENEPEEDYAIGELSDAEAAVIELYEEDEYDAKSETHKEFTISNVELLKPKTMGVEGPIAPIEKDVIFYYTTKLRIQYEGTS